MVNHFEKDKDDKEGEKKEEDKKADSDRSDKDSLKSKDEADNNSSI
jgi:hypothetical protein